MIPLGIRLNNPSNIRYNVLNNWKGQVKSRCKNGFCYFSRPEYGVRALLSLLRTYIYRYNLTSVRQIISRFAPSSDGNDTELYIKNVCKHLSCSPDSSLSFDFYSTSIASNLFYLASAICKQETGFELSHSVFTLALRDLMSF